MRIVFFATGPVTEAAREVARLLRSRPLDSLSVVAPGVAAEVLRAATGARVLAYHSASLPVLLMKLWAYLGLARAEVICLSCGSGWRFLKLAAYALRGRVVFVRPGQGSAPLGLGAFLWISISRLWARENGVLLVGSAGPETLLRIEEDLRRRRPGSAIHLLHSFSLGEFARTALHWRRFRYLSVPWTAEGHNALKLAALLLPCGRREIYNQHGDSYSVRRVGVLAHHVFKDRPQPQRFVVVGSAPGARLARVVANLRRRCPRAPVYGLLRSAQTAEAGALFDAAFGWHELGKLRRRLMGSRRSTYVVIPCTREGHNLLKLAGWLLPLGFHQFYNENDDFYPAREVRTLAAHLWRRLWELPPGVTVLGSASGYYLKGIVQDLRRRRPDEPIHALLPPRLEGPAGALFDSVTMMRTSAPSTWWTLLRRAFGTKRTGWYVIPCTNEGFYGLKLLCWLLPLGRREIYNENCDSYTLRSVGMLARHAAWRLHHRLFYQALTERRDRPWPLHVIHLLLYPARLLAGAALLAEVRLRAAWQSRPAEVAPQPEPRRGELPGSSEPQTQELFDTAKR